MKLKDLIIEPEGQVKEISNYIRQELENYVKLCTNEEASPCRLYYDYWSKGKIMHKINALLIEKYPIIIRSGHKTKKNFYVNNIGTITMCSIIGTATKGKFVFGKNRIRNYNLKSFQLMVDIAISMLLIKYDAKSLCKEHYVYTVLATMFFYYRVFDENKLIVNVSDVKPILLSVLNSDELHYMDVAKYYKFYDSHPSNSYNKIKVKPLSKEDFTCCYSEGATQTEKMKAISKWWNCSERTARRYMQDFGLTNQKYVRSDYRKEDGKVCISSGERDQMKRMTELFSNLSEKTILLPPPLPPK